MSELFQKKLNIQVKSQEECEQVDYVVCVLWPDHLFPDDVRSKCCACGREIGHRPHVPKKPPKICVECVLVVAETAKQRPN